MNDSLLRNAFQLHQSGRLQDAARIYGEILGADPAHCDALYLLGVTHFQSGDFHAALRCYDRALEARSTRADVRAARGAALSGLGRHEDALAAYDDALARNPGQAVAWNHRGNALLELKRETEAVASYDRALALNPDYAEAWRHRAVALTHSGRHDEAIASIERALTADPGDAPAREEYATLLYNRANAHAIAKRYSEAIRDCEALLRIVPDYAYARGVLVHSKLQCCDWPGLEAQKAKLSEGIAAAGRVISPFNHKALSDSPAEQLQCARAWVANECPAAKPLWRGERFSHGRIRLAYVSADFNNTAVAGLMAEIFERHDRNTFETIAISFGPDTRTPMRRRLEAGFERFLDLHDKTSFGIASAMRAMEVGIAIDLMGFTGECRPAIFAHRPAPVQVNYLGFPGTMGADYMDYILADRVVIAPESQHFYAEKVAYLPGSFLPASATRPTSLKPVSRREAGLPNEGFVFVSLNNVYKFNAEAFSAWMRLLDAVPQSVLWLPEMHEEAARNLRREAQARGIDAARMVFAPKLPSYADHLARLSLADLFLDTLPYNAHSTAIDALLAGLPILTLAGESFAGRVAASLLTAHGIPELVTHTRDDYESTALHLARDPEALAAVRRKVVEKRETSPLFDTARFTRHLEAAYTEMWTRHQRGEPPAGFAVAAAP